MNSATALDLSTRRYTIPTPRHPGWVSQEPGLRYAYLRPSRCSPDGRRLLLQLAREPRPARSSFARHAARMLRRARRLAYQSRRLVIRGAETCAFGTSLATFLGCVWLLGN